MHKYDLAPMCPLFATRNTHLVVAWPGTEAAKILSARVATLRAIPQEAPWMNSTMKRNAIRTGNPKTE